MPHPSRLHAGRSACVRRLARRPTIKDSCAMTETQSSPAGHGTERFHLIIPESWGNHVDASRKYLAFLTFYALQILRCGVSKDVLEWKGMSKDGHTQKVRPHSRYGIQYILGMSSPSSNDDRLPTTFPLRDSVSARLRSPGQILGKKKPAMACSVAPGVPGKPSRGEKERRLTESVDGRRAYPHCAPARTVKG